MSHRLFLLGLLLSLCFSAQIVLGEEPEPAWVVTPMVGFSLFEGELGIEDRPVFGLGAGMKLNERWGFEGSLSYLGTETRGTEKSDLEIYQLAMSLIYVISPTQRLSPYLLAGGGGFSANSDGFGTKSGGALHLGAGLRYGLNSRLSLKGEVRHQTFFGMIDDEGKRKTAHNLTTLVGLDVRFPQTQASAATVSPAPEKKVEEPPIMTKAPSVAKALPPESPEQLTDEELRRIDASSATASETGAAPELSAPTSTSAELRVAPRFAAGGEELLGWAPDDLGKIGDQIHIQPMAKIFIVGDVDEGSLTFDKFKLLERRALRLRLFLIERFELASASVEVLSPNALDRRIKKLSHQPVVIRFTPSEGDRGKVK
jgi:hypothetical protein